MNLKYPKVLILIQPFNNNTGGGITLSNLFYGWPKDKIAVAGLGGLINNQTKTDVCDTYYQLGKEEVKWKFPFNIIKRKIFSGQINFDQPDRLPKIKKNTYRSYISINFIDPFLIWIGLYEFIYKIELSIFLKFWMDDFKADIIYSQAHTRGRILFCTKVQEYLKIPMVFHMMDDWIPFVKKQSLLGQYWFKKSDADFRDMLSKSSLYLSISEGMAREYKQRYGYDFITFHNPIQLDFWKKGQRSDYELGNPPTILYAGRTGIGIQHSLKLMAEAVEFINIESKMNIRFVLQISEELEWIKKFSCIEFRSFVLYEELPNKFGEADVLFLPYDFNVKSIDFIKLSMPTKASEFMASGTPILILAPANTALVRYAEEFGWAKILTDDSLVLLIQTLKELFSNSNLRKEIGTLAISVASDRHDATKVRKEFHDAINSLLTKKP